MSIRVKAVFMNPLFVHESFCLCGIVRMPFSFSGILYEKPVHPRPPLRRINRLSGFANEVSRAFMSKVDGGMRFEENLLCVILAAPRHAGDVSDLMRTLRAMRDAADSLLLFCDLSGCVFRPSCPRMTRSSVRSSRASCRLHPACPDVFCCSSAAALGMTTRGAIWAKASPFVPTPSSPV